MSRRAELQVLDVPDRLVDQPRDVMVVERVDDAPAPALADHQATVSQELELMRDGGLFHPHCGDQLRNRLRPHTQPRQDQNPARRRERVHRLGDALGDRWRNGGPVRVPLAVILRGRAPILCGRHVSMSDRSLNNSSYDTDRQDDQTPARTETRPSGVTMSGTAPALIAAAAGVGLGHAILPDHWLPLAVLGRTRRYSLTRIARLSGLAGVAHVLVSVLMGGVIIAIGLQFRSTLEHAQDTIVGSVLIATGLGFTVLELSGRGHAHPHDGEHGHGHSHGHHNHHDHDHADAPDTPGRGLRGIAAIMIPFGAAASPDLTILPVFLAATAVGVGTAIGSLVAFAVVTISTIVGLTLLGTVGGYQLKGRWLDRWGNAITAATLLAIGVLVLTGTI